VDYLSALNKLGQFDLDQSDFDDAEKELQEGIKKARALAREKPKGVDYKGALLNAIRSYADLLRQKHHDDEVKSLLKEANELEKQESRM
jgi:hypothetical protein